MPSATAVSSRTRELESLAGLSAIDAIARLRALELRPAVEACESGREAHGVVLAHEPVAGVDVRRGQLVTLLVGERQTVTAPDETPHDPEPRGLETRTAAARAAGDVVALAPPARTVCQLAAARASPAPEPPSDHGAAALVAAPLAAVSVLAGAPTPAFSPVPATAPADRDGEPRPPADGSLPREPATASEARLHNFRRPRARRGRPAAAASAVVLAAALVAAAIALVHVDPVGRADLSATASGASSFGSPRRHPRRTASANERVRRASASSRPPADAGPGRSRLAPAPRAPAAAGAPRETPSAPLTGQAAAARPRATGTPAPVSPLGPLPGPPPSP